MTRWATTPREPHERWTVVDRSGVQQGLYDFGGAQDACLFLNAHGNYGPYRVQPLRNTRAA